MLDFDTETREHVDVLLEHLNGKHADTVLFVARHHRPDVVDAELSTVDPAGAVLGVRGTGEVDRVRLEFPVVASSAFDVRQHLVAAVGVARAADPSAPLTSLESELRTTASLPTVHGVVRRVERLTPNLLEVTVSGFDDYPLAGGDEFVYVMVSPEGIEATYSMADYREQAAEDPVHGAYYTVRRSRADVGEIDLWVVEHDHPGSVAHWMRHAEPGEPLAFWGPRRGFEMPDAGDVLLVADETGCAAVAALVEAASDHVRIVAVLETVGVDHHPPMPEHPSLRIVWVDRGADAPGTVNRLLGAVRDQVTVAPVAAFGAAESRQISAIRRHLRAQMAMPTDAVSMTGYWRLA